MPVCTEVHVDQAQITNLKCVEKQSVGLGDGQVRIKISNFALTANNVTYAATGFAVGYWNFFPTGIKGMGIVPVWGFGEVIETSSADAKVGDRLYGYYPMATELVITPSPVGTFGLEDVSEHRKDLPAIYNLYVRSKEKTLQQEQYQALLQPLIATSFLLYDWLFDNAWFGAEQIIIGSASSKTGIGLCAFLNEQTDRPYKIIGLTSAGNSAFVKELGFCDQVCTYDDIETLAKGKSVYVDMAGNAAVKQRLHMHLADMLAHSSAVGISHWDKFARPENLAGPKPVFFFAPAQIAKRKKDWGPGVIERKIGEASAKIEKDAARWLSLQENTGLEAACNAYDELASGKAKPNVGYVISL